MRLLVALAVLIAGLAAVPASVSAQDDTENPVTVRESDQQPVGGIVVKPNSGTPPENAGDRGGALQVILFALLIGFGVIAVFSIRRSSRKALAAQGRT